MSDIAAVGPTFNVLTTLLKNKYLKIASWWVSETVVKRQHKRFDQRQTDRIFRNMYFHGQEGHRTGFILEICIY